MVQLNASMPYQQVCNMVGSIQKNWMFFSVQEISEVKSAGLSVPGSFAIEMGPCILSP